ATIKTATPGNYYVGELVIISGVSVPEYNGTFAITAVTSSNSFTYTAATSGLAAGSGGTAKNALGGRQRSRVSSLIYTFNHPGSLAAGAFSIGLTANVAVNGTSGQTVGTLPTLSWSTPDNGLTYFVTFSGNGVVNGSIADGVYDITLDHTKVTD